MEVIEYCDQAAFTELRNEWNSLASKSGTNTVFQRCEWHRCWWETFGKESELHLIAVRDRSTLIGLAPLMISPARINYRAEKVLQFIGAKNVLSDYCDFLIERSRPEALNLILSKILDIQSRWSILDLFNLPGESPNLDQTKKFFAKHNQYFRTRYLYDAPRHVFNAQSRDAIFQKKSIKRHVNKLNRAGKVEFQNLSADQAQPLLDTFFKQHTDRRESIQQSGQFTDPAQRLFFERILHDQEMRAHVRFSALFLDQKPIAFHFGFEYCGTFYWYKPSFDVAWAALSPGEVMLKNLFEYAIDRKLRVFDFTVGSEPFKYRFSNEIKGSYELLVYANKISYIIANLRGYLSNMRKSYDSEHSQLLSA